MRGGLRPVFLARKISERGPGHSGQREREAIFLAEKTAIALLSAWGQFGAALSNSFFSWSEYPVAADALLLLGVKPHERFLFLRDLQYGEERRNRPIERRFFINRLRQRID